MKIYLALGAPVHQGGPRTLWYCPSGRAAGPSHVVGYLAEPSPNVDDAVIEEACAAFNVYHRHPNHRPDVGSDVKGGGAV